MLTEVGVWMKLELEGQSLEPPDRNVEGGGGAA